MKYLKELMEYGYENYNTLFKGFIVSFGVLLAMLGQMIPVFEESQLESRKSQYYLESIYNLPAAEVKCEFINQKCRLAKYHYEHNENLISLQVMFMSILGVISVALFGLSFGGFWKEMKQRVGMNQK